MKKKVFIFINVFVAAAVALASPTSIDADTFAVLSCSCQELAPDGHPVRPDNIELGIKEGLSFVRGAKVKQ